MCEPLRSRVIDEAMVAQDLSLPGHAPGNMGAVKKLLGFDTPVTVPISC